MQYNSHASNQDIISDITFLLTGSYATTTDFHINGKTRCVNRWYNRVVSLILQADNRWEWDDTNQTDLPIATTTLVASQQDYQISGVTFLRINRVEVLNNAGDYQQINPISQQDLRGTALSEYKETAGMPQEYDLIGDSFFLYPKPASASVTLTAGLKVYFQRNVVAFTTTDTTAVPGFAEPFHRILSFGAAMDYAIANNLTSKISIFQNEINKLEAGLIEFYSNRHRDSKVRMRLKNKNYAITSNDSAWWTKNVTFT